MHKLETNKRHFSQRRYVRPEHKFMSRIRIKS